MEINYFLFIFFPALAASWKISQIIKGAVSQTKTEIFQTSLFRGSTVPGCIPPSARRHFPLTNAEHAGAYLRGHRPQRVSKGAYSP